jgi:hypothetical protein
MRCPPPMLIASMTYLMSKSGPKTLQTSFKLIYKQFDILKMIHMHVLWLLKNGVKTACKMELFGSAEQFNVWCTQWAGSDQFFSVKLSGYHVVT